MKNNIKLTLTFSLGGIICITSFILAWIFYEVPNLLVWLWDLELVVIAIIVSTVALIQKHRPDERLMNILKSAIRNSWTLLIVGLPIIGTILIYIIINNQVLNAMMLFTTWNIALLAFGVTIIYQFWE
ncbi:MAG: hypothetical protein ACW96U_13025 [Candidatus Heimdallarchaeaceae archaeon]|jgi:hypothetical protein